MNSARQRAAALAILVLIIGAGAYLRFSHLTTTSLTQEELNHHYVGKALAAGDAPRLPSGQLYLQGIEYSAVVSLLSERVQSTVLEVRVPAAILGTLAVVAIAIGTWSLAGAWVAVGGTLLFALYPEAVTQSRTGRFYTLQLLIFLGAFFLGWHWLVRRFDYTRLRSWAIIGLVTGLLLLASHIQVTTLPSLLAWGVVLAVVGVRDLARRVTTWRTNVPIQFVAVAFLMVAALVAYDPTLVSRGVTRALSVPYWALMRHESNFFYLWVLTREFNLIALAAPLAFAWLLLQRSVSGFYLFAMFAIPAFVLSFVLPFKAERFLLLATPPLFIATAAGCAAAAKSLANAVRRLLQRRGVSALASERIATATIVVLLVGGLLAMQAPRRAPSRHWNRREAEWRSAAAILKARPELNKVPFGATKSLPPLFYWGRVDFNVARNYLEQWNSPLIESFLPKGLPEGYVMLPSGSKDAYAGVPVIPGPDQIRSWFAKERGVIIGIDSQASYYGMVDAGLLEELDSNAEELCQSRCGALRLYYWRFR